MVTAKIYRNGKNQIIRLPRGYRLDGSEYYVNRVGDAIVLLPMNDPWHEFYNSLGKFSDDFLKIREQDEIQERNPF